MAEEADRMEGAEQHEQEHLPGPSFWPILLALGISMSLIGVITKLAVLIIGLLITLIALGGWIRDARRDYRELT
jgi:hypothetical protein